MNNYPPKTIILPGKFMQEFSIISNMPHIKELFSGYTLLKKEIYLTPIQEGLGKEILVEENTNIPVMNLNSKNLAGFIIEKDYSCFFVEVFATETKTQKQIRAGIFLVVLQDKNILSWREDKSKIKIETNGGNGYALCFYDFREKTIKTLTVEENKKANKKVMDWYLSAISQFLDILGLSKFPLSESKPK